MEIRGRLERKWKTLKKESVLISYFISNSPVKSYIMLFYLDLNSSHSYHYASPSHSPLLNLCILVQADGVVCILCLLLNEELEIRVPNLG